MKAYQYFHLPNGYEAKVSDNNQTDLAFIEKIRTSLSGNFFLAYILLGEQNAYILNSKADENKNQFIRGRIASLNEITTLSIGYIENIPDMRLMRVDMSLMPRPYMPANFMFRPYPLNKGAFATLFDKVTQGKPINAFFNSTDDALLTIKTLLSILPGAYQKKLSYIIAENPGPFSFTALDPYGRSSEAKVNFYLINHPLGETDKNFGEYIDFTSPEVKGDELSPLASMILDKELTNPSHLNDLKQRFATYISENGIDLSSLALVEKQDAFYKDPTEENLNELINLIAQSDYDSQMASINKLGEYMIGLFASQEVTPSLLATVANLRRMFPPFADIINAPYSSYLINNFLSLEGEAVNDFAYLLASDMNTFDEFFIQTENEVNPKRKSKRLEILFSSLFMGGGNLDQATIKDNIIRLMNIVDIRNNYQLLTFEERNNGEDLFYAVPTDGNLNDLNKDFLAFLVYTAYTRDTDEEWKKMRLKGLEKRLAPYPVLEKLRILIQIRNSLESFSDFFYTEISLAITDLNNFYFDLYGDSLKTELLRNSYDEVLTFYDEYRSTPYNALLNALCDTLCDLGNFLSAYPELTFEQNNHFLSLFESMPISVKQTEVTNYLKSLVKEHDLNEAFVTFRTNFLEKTYDLLSSSDKRLLPPLPSYNSLKSEKVKFSEQLAVTLASFDGEYQLLASIHPKTREASTNNRHNPIPIPIPDPTPQIKRLPLEVTLDYKPNRIKPFDVRVEISSDIECEVPALRFVMSRLAPTSPDDGVTLYTFSGGKIKKGFFGMKSLFFSFRSVALEDRCSIHIVLENPNEPYIIKKTVKGS